MEGADYAMDRWKRGMKSWNRTAFGHLVAGCILLSNSEYLAKHRVLMIIAVTWGKGHKLIGMDTVCTKNDGSKEWFWRMIRQNLSGIFNSTYENLRQQEDLTCYSKRNKRSSFWFATWHVPCNKILIQNGEMSLRDIKNLLLRWEKEDWDALLLLYL